MRNFTLLVVISVLHSMSQPALASRLYVNASVATPGDGSTWQTAVPRLQDALAIALIVPTVDEIWVARGTYRPDRGANVALGDRTAAFHLQNGLAIYGGFAGTETQLSQRQIDSNTGLAVLQSVLSGDLAGNDAPNFTNYGENSFHVVRADSVDATAVLDGLTISAGYDDGGFSLEGAGLRVYAASPVIRRCRFVANLGDGNLAGGGGASNDAGSAPLYQFCRFENNGASSGGGMFSRNSQPTIINCAFISNWCNLRSEAVARSSLITAPALFRTALSTVTPA